MNITVGNLKVLTSGILFFEKDKEIIFDLDKMILYLMIKDNAEKKTSIDFEVDEKDKNKGRIYLYNVDAYKSGIFKPLELGMLDDKKIYFAFSIQKMETNVPEHDGYQLVYCWYVEE